MMSSHTDSSLTTALLVSALLHGLALGGLAFHGKKEAARLAGTTTLSVSLIDAQEAHKASEPAPLPQTVKQPLEPLMEKVVEQVVRETGKDLENSVASVAAAVAAPTTENAIREASFNADYLHNPKPQYPALSRRLGEQGRVLLHVQVSVEGKALAVSVKESSGFKRLDDAAVTVVKQWQFVPAKQGDTALVSWVDVPIQFSLAK